MNAHYVGEKTFEYLKKSGTFKVQYKNGVECLISKENKELKPIIKSPKWNSENIKK